MRGGLLPAFILLFSLFQNAALHAQDISVRISDIQYGIATKSGRPLTGSHIDRVPTKFEIYEMTDRIPMTPSTDFGFEMKVRASEGKTLQIIVVWEGPDGVKISDKTIGASIRNGRELKKSFSFDRNDQPGNWLLKVYLVGIDSSMNEVKNSKVSLGSMKLYEKEFEMYKPKLE